MLLLNQYSESLQLAHLLYHPDKTCKLIPPSTSRIFLSKLLLLLYFCHSLYLYRLLIHSIISLLLAFVVSNFPKVNVNYHYVIPILKNVHVSTLTYGIKFKLKIPNASLPSTHFKVIYLLKTPMTWKYCLYTQNNLMHYSLSYW